MKRPLGSFSVWLWFLAAYVLSGIAFLHIPLICLAGLPGPVFRFLMTIYGPLGVILEKVKSL